MRDDSREIRDIYLTDRQLEIMKFRKDGLSTEKIAERIGTTRQNVTILEKRAHRNLDRAIRTLNAVRDLNISIDFEIPGQMHILDAVKEIVKRADESGIRLNDNLIGIMTRFKVSMEKDLKGGITRRAITVIMFQNGSVQFF